MSEYFCQTLDHEKRLQNKSNKKKEITNSKPSKNLDQRYGLNSIESEYIDSPTGTIQPKTNSLFME